MSAWIVIADLLTLRAEFNAVNPARDKGADGTVGNEEHTSSSDHTPDEDSAVLRDRDADNINEVHALDIDSTGPWPDSGWFNRTILEIVEREKADFESPTIIGRLQYVIWNKRIASRSVGWAWAAYDGDDPHTNHAHFSGRYVTAAEADTRPWGVADMPLTAADGKTLWASDTIPNPSARPDSPTNPETTARFAIGDVWRLQYEQSAAIAALRTEVAALKGQVAVLAAKGPLSLPADFAAQVADVIAARLKA